MKSVKKLLADKAQSYVWSVSSDNTVIDALHLMAEKNIGAVVVIDNNQLVGIFSERDYARKGIIKGRKAKSTPIAEVMTSRVFTVSPDTDIKECMKLFSEKKFRHLPVVEDDQVIGILSIGDIVNSIMKEQVDHIQFLESYITNA
ncbi:CBS domain-containing protein [Runella zeae]|uniref:CBS domain-containing protein n=1 Tax=Runella zeae TaxID=94255 RepID=UPI00042654B2|nr:CBS domain-containing protein [Runella zeae]